MANYLTRTYGSGGNLKKWTKSFWFKTAGLYGGYTGNQHIMSLTKDSGNDQGLSRLRLNNNGTLEFFETGGLELKTTKIFMDPTAWYHVVNTWDSNNATSSDRGIMYVNGTRVTAFGTANYPSQNVDSMTNTASQTHGIGSNVHNDGWSGTRTPFQGQLAHVHFCDGYAYSPSDFGETDTTTGIWKPKSAPSVSYGTTGYFLKFENSANLGLDSSGNSNNWTVVNGQTYHQSVDTPTNNFCAMSPLNNLKPGAQFEQRNLYVSSSSSAYTMNESTHALNKGKWYVEGYVDNIGPGSDNWMFGLTTKISESLQQRMGDDNQSIALRNNGQYKYGGNNVNHGASFAAGTTAMLAIDLDNNNIYFGNNGQWMDGNGNTDEANPTAAVSISGMFSDLYDVAFVAFGDATGSGGAKIKVNFGSPTFALSSAQSDANGYGNFEYSPPSGYYAICTKNINQYG